MTLQVFQDVSDEVDLKYLEFRRICGEIVGIVLAEHLPQGRDGVAQRLGGAERFSYRDGGIKGVSAHISLPFATYKRD
jgi:hypothetical protein